VSQYLETGYYTNDMSSNVERLATKGMQGAKLSRVSIELEGGFRTDIKCENARYPDLSLSDRTRMADAGQRDI
jgi:hypothetical protein